MAFLTDANERLSCVRIHLLLQAFVVVINVGCFQFRLSAFVI